MSNFILKIKRAETPFYSFLNRLIKSILRLHFPCIKIIHLPLYHLDYLVKAIVRRLIHIFWSVPVFMARCTKVGKGLSLPNGIPLIIGSHLKIFLGDNVTIYRSTIGASKIFDEAVLKVGNYSSIGYGTVISVAKEVTIGDNCLIAPNCMIMDNDDHPVDPKKRLEGQPIDPEDAKSVKIGNNVWIGSYCAILKGVKIGDNSVIATHSVVTKDIMPNCVYAGYPARPTVRDIHKKFD
jgi:acetyltransferase-like isoleucine patch superfamily enzyme